MTKNIHPMSTRSKLKKNGSNPPSSDDVKSEATMTVSAHAGDGVLEALDKLAPKLSEI